MDAGGDTASERPDPGPTRRRARVDHVGDELAALRRDLGQQGALLSEVAPRVDQLSDTVARLASEIASLVTAVEQKREKDEADKRARQAVGMWPEPAGPWCWPTMHRGDAETAWRALDLWVEHVLCRQHHLALAQLPGCWALHWPAVLELAVLRQTHLEAHSPGAGAARAAEWHVRWFPAALAAVAQIVDAERCPPLMHLVVPEQRPTKREQEQVGAAPCRPEHWRPALQRVAAADIATRREAPDVDT